MTTETDITTLRTFNRTYTARLGLLKPRLDASPFTLSEARILYEIAHREAPSAAAIGRDLGLDRAQLSRTLQRFAGRGLIAVADDPAHKRRQLLSLTDAGRAAFAALDADTRAAIGGLLEALPTLRRARLVTAARAITAALDDTTEVAPVLRALRAGDLGWIVHRQAVLYAQEYGWNADYEALIAGILADWHRAFDPARDDGWVAEEGGTILGSIFLVRSEATGVAKLRLLYVEPAARGRGIGDRLIETCVGRARTLGYARLELWTNDVLTAARRSYRRAGFHLVDETPHYSFGHDLIGQTWEMDLR